MFIEEKHEGSQTYYSPIHWEKLTIYMFLLNTVNFNIEILHLII
jgi:hypothetical protein